ncbi:MAG: EF-hand domain-containing protein [Gammaproteobacteria bacterium]|jgi:Ca2+-binding EF-hand superfamily protein|nr:EF-hand domain-containing protein [Gammaproteobacteria bacterium]
MNDISGDDVELREHYDFCDTDGDGRISYGEFVELLRNLDADMSEEEMRLGFRLIDANGSGWIGFPEFERWWVEDLG